MDIAQKTFDIHNDVQTIDPSDLLFKYDKKEQQRLLNEQPWKKDPHWFKEVKISAVALIKMVIHARSGGLYEIMGLLNGTIHAPTRSFIVTDTFALPVQGTETRVNAGNEAMEYMVEFQRGNEEAGKGELVVGWYHSHPGYGCWLSGIDVNTQQTNQNFSDPYLAIVVDPNRTISAGKVEIGAFRTYPPGYTSPASSSSSEYQSIPLSKIEDFGVHANAYYPLKVSVFKSSLDKKLLDLLWGKYWVGTLSQSSVVSSRSYATSQLHDLQAKLAQTETKLSQARNGGGAGNGGILSPLVNTITKKAAGAGGSGKGSAEKELREKGANVGAAEGEAGRWEEKEGGLMKAAKDSMKISSEAQQGLIAQNLKDRLFNTDLRVPVQPLVPGALGL